MCVVPLVPAHNLTHTHTYIHYIYMYNIHKHSLSKLLNYMTYIYFMNVNISFYFNIVMFFYMSFFNQHYLIIQLL